MATRDELDREFWHGVYRLLGSFMALIAKRWGFKTKE
jgi:hypothetical protein